MWQGSALVHLNSDSYIAYELTGCLKQNIALIEGTLNLSYNKSNKV